MAHLYHELRLPLLQHYRQRFVATFVHLVKERLHPAVLNAPALVLVHAPEVNPETLVPQVKVVKRRKLAIQCADGRGQMTLSLVRPR